MDKERANDLLIKKAPKPKKQKKVGGMSAEEMHEKLR
jgi:hypothetical protein